MPTFNSRYYVKLPECMGKLAIVSQRLRSGLILSYLL